MAVYFNLIFNLITIVFVDLTNAEKAFNSATFFPTCEVSINKQTTLQTLTQVSEIECAIHCNKLPECLTIGYGMTGGDTVITCYLLNTYVHNCSNIDDTGKSITFKFIEGKSNVHEASGVFNLIFAVDTSGSGYKYANKIKQYMINLVSNYTIGLESMRVALVVTEHSSCVSGLHTNSTPATLMWGLTSAKTSSMSALKSAIENFPFQGVDCDFMPYTYRYITDNLIVDDCVPTVIVSFGDGEHSRYSSTMEKEVAVLKLKTEIMIGIGFGSYNFNNMEQISESKSYVFPLTSIEGAKAAIDAVMSKNVSNLC